MHITPGFYHHYKHDPNGPINNYAYEVLGVGSHTEKEEHVVVYRSLYHSPYGNDMFAIRPYDMFIENVQVKGETTPRFRLITDTIIIKELMEVREVMYPLAV